MLLLQRREAEVPVERFGGLVLRLDQHRHRADLRRGLQTAAQRVHQQELALLLALELVVHGQPAQQDHRELWVTRQPLGQLGWQLIGGDDRGRQCEVAQDVRRGWGDQHEGGGDTLVRVLPGLLLQVAVQRLDSTGEAAAVVGLVEGLDAQRRDGGRQSKPRLLPVVRRRLAQAIRRGRRIEQGAHERDLVGPTQADGFVLLDDLGRRLLRTGHHEFAQRPTGEHRGTHQHGFLVGGDAGFQAG